MHVKDKNKGEPIMNNVCLRKYNMKQFDISTEGITDYEATCIDAIVSDWKRCGISLNEAIEMAYKAIEKSEYYDMTSDWNEDTIEYMIENWDCI